MSSKLVATTYRAFLREIARASKTEASITLLEPFNIHEFGSWKYVSVGEDAVGQLHQRLFPEIDFKTLGFEKTLTFDFPSIAKLVKQHYRLPLAGEDDTARNAALAHRLDMALQHFAAFTALHKQNAAHAIRTTSFPATTGRSALEVEIATQFCPTPDADSTFMYRVRLRNVGDTTIQLVGRRLSFIDANNAAIQVTGTGVVGQHPELAPNTDQAFEYVSGTTIKTPSGVMQGQYLMVVSETQESFEAVLPTTPFLK